MESFRDSQLIPPLANLPFAVNHNSPQAQGLVAWWPLNDLAGRTVECRIRAGNRGTLGDGGVAYNAVRPWYVDGALGVCNVNDGGGGTNYITTGFADALDDFTACVWFRVVVATFFGRIMDKDQGVAGTGFMMYFSDPTLTADIRGTTMNITGATGKNYHGVVRRSGTSGAFILNGGTQKATAAVSATALSTSALGLGASSGGNNRSFIELRDARIYNRALSDHEIWALYDPVTRYELFYPLGQKSYGIPVGTPVPGPRNQVIIVG